MRSVCVALAAATAIGVAAAHAAHHEAAPPSEEAWGAASALPTFETLKHQSDNPICPGTASKYGGSPDLSFSGITTFARTPHARCLDEPNSLADIVILGMPFDVRPEFPMNAT